MNLERPGATLSYDIAGSGPLLLLIPGGAMDSRPFTGLQHALSDRFTVARYDARGIGASRFTGDPHPITIAGQADDAPALIDELSPDAPAFVLGSSGGALTGFELVDRHPSRVRRLVAHEPPLNGLPGTAERSARDLARLLGQEPTVFVGEHVGFAEDPQRFGEQLAPLLV